MAKADKKNIDIPESAVSKKADEDFRIHVMPKEFKGKTANLKQKPVAAKPVPPPKKVASKPLPAPVKPAQKKGRRSTIVLLLVGVIIILLFVLAALFVLNSIEKEPVIVPDEDPIVTPDEPDEPMIVEDEPITQGLDTDSDGLTDVEESLYGTDFRNPDTDADSFLDGNEVFHRYDPIGYAPSTLLDTGSVEIYEAQGSRSFEIYYPRTWRVQDSFDPATDITSEVEFTSSTRATISISTSEKGPDHEFQDWYEVNGDDEVDFRELIDVMSKEGYMGYMEPESLVTYLDTDEAVYRLEYDVSREDAIEYLQTFQMMVNSFVLP